MLQNLQNSKFAKVQQFQLDNLVDFEKCWKTRIYTPPLGGQKTQAYCLAPQKNLLTGCVSTPFSKHMWRPETSESVGWQNFGKMLLVFGCIGSDFCKKICVLQHFSKSTRFSSWNFWNLTKFCKFCDICNFFAEISRKLLFFQTDFLRKFWDCSGAKGCKSCRAWKMLSNAYFLAKFRFDTAENEPAKICKMFYC